MNENARAAFVMRLFWLLSEGLELHDAVAEVLNRSGFPTEHAQLEADVFSLSTRRLMLERSIAREEQRLALASRDGASSEILASRARVAAARQRLLA